MTKHIFFIQSRRNVLIYLQVSVAQLVPHPDFCIKAKACEFEYTHQHLFFLKLPFLKPFFWNFFMPIEVVGLCGSMYLISSQLVKF